MTVQNIKVKLIPKFPANVTATSPILLDKTGGTYAFGFDTDSIVGPIVAEVESLLTITTANNTGIPGSASTQLNADIAAVVAAGGGKLRLPAGIYDCSGTLIVVDVSALATRFQGRIIIEGDGVATVIRNSVGACFRFIGSAANPEAYFELRNIRFIGNNVPTAVGLDLTKAAFVTLRDVTIEKFGVGLQATDVDQIGIYDSEIRFNVGGVVCNASTTVSDPNSWTWVNSCVSNNSSFGLQISNANSWVWLGGSIQYNGIIGGGAGQYGILMADAGTGYGNVLFSGMAFEGNGGAGDFLSQQAGAGTSHCNFTFDTVSFLRTAGFITVGYGTNQVNISGTRPDANYKFINCNFYGFAPYAASAGRPAIANTNANAKIEIDGLTKFWSNTEAPTTSALYTGYPGSRTGSVFFAGVTSGAVEVAGPAIGSGKITLPAGTTDFSATGGASRFLKQASAGGPLTVVQPAYTDLSGAPLIVEVLTANRTYFVRSDGSDSNTGLVNSAGGAFLTIQKGADAAKALDRNGFNVTVDASQYTSYTSAVSIVGPFRGAGAFTISGNTGSPSSCVWNVTSNNGLGVGEGAVVNIQGFEMRTATAGDCLVAYSGGQINQIGAMRFNNCAGSHVTAQSMGRVNLAASYTILGSSVSHLHTFSQGYISVVSLTVTLSGTPTWSAYFAGVADADIGISAVTFSGAGTGPSGLVHDLGRLDTSGITLPGNGVISYDTWGQYNSVFGGSNPLSFFGATSGNTTLQAAATASGALTLPAASGTLATLPGAWTAATPALSSTGGAFTSATATAHYLIEGKRLTYTILIVITTVGGASGLITLTLPGTATVATGGVFAGVETATAAMCVGSVASGGSTLSIAKYDGTSIIAAGRFILVSGVMEIQ